MALWGHRQLLEQFKDLFGTADHSSSDPNKCEQGDNVPRCYAGRGAIDPRAMCEQSDHAGNDERFDAESGQHKCKRNGRQQQQSRSHPDCEKCGEIEGPSRQMQSELRLKAMLCFS